MFIYWLLFSIPALAAMSPIKLHPQVRVLFWYFVALLFMIIVGFRWEVGRDWILYLRFHYESMIGVSFEKLIEFILENGYDPVFTWLNWIMASHDIGIVGVNLVCSIIFISGLFSFCRRQPRPWLALTVAIPIPLIIVAMGYNRQGVALGCAFFALGALTEKRILTFILFVAFGTMFHKSMLALLPLGLLVNTSKRYLTILLLIPFCFLINFEVLKIILLDYSNFEGASNFQKGMSAPGAPVRVALNFLPAVIFLLHRKRFGLEQIELQLWTWMSISAFLFIPLLIFFPSSAVVDRLGIYLTPIQLFVYSRFHCLFRAGNTQQLVTVFVILIYATIQFVWLNYGSNSFAWEPYQFYPFDPSITSPGTITEFEFRDYRN